MQCNLPDRLYSWAWTPEYLDSQESPDPALCRFSAARDGGTFSWLWFFPDRQQAASLRVIQALPVHDDDALAKLVALSIPRGLPDRHRPTYLALMDRDWLARLPLQELGIDEVWIGFDYRAYVRDKNPRAAISQSLSAVELTQYQRPLRWPPAP